MSRIYWHTQNDGTAELRGSERAHFAAFCSDVLWAVLERHADETYGKRSRLRDIIPVDHYSQKDWGRSGKMAFVGFSDVKLRLGDKELEPFALQLNTAYSMGADHVKLAARLHGQCEIHAYVEGQNRAWLAEIIQQGRVSGFYRDDAGWESVLDLLAKSSTEAVVTSYSVCEGFPNGHVANFDYPELDGEKDWDAWDALPRSEKWAMGLAGVRSGGGLELKPDNWNTFYFRDGMNAHQLVAELYKAVAP